MGGFLHVWNIALGGICEIYRSGRVWYALITFLYVDILGKHQSILFTYRHSPPPKTRPGAWTCSNSLIPVDVHPVRCIQWQNSQACVIQ